MRKFARKNAPDLHTHSTFSLLDGFGSPESVVKRAKELGWGAVCLTEHGWMGSVPPFYQACEAHKIKPILGVEFYVVPDEILGVKDKETRSASYHLTVLALSAEGYHNLVHWTTRSMQPENFYYRPRISIEAMIESAPWPLHHNVILSGCLASELCQSIAADGDGMDVGIAYVEAMKSVWPNFYVEVQKHEHPRFMGKGFEAYETLVVREKAIREKLLAIAEATRTPVVLTNDSHFQSQEQRKAHISMMASKMKRWTQEDTHYGQSQEHEVKSYVRDYAYWRNYMQSMEAIADGSDDLVRACGNAIDIVREADIRLEPLRSFSYSIPDSGYDNPIETIRARSLPRLRELVGRYGEAASDRFEHELEAMGDFAHYLLMMSDFIIHAREQGILTNTRGSAANSIVCYCLHIHEYDSIKYKLTFERFVNPERKKLPDIDIDIQYDRYEDFMEYVKEYVQEREGDNLMLLCNYGTLANRSTFRMVAEGLGIPKEEQDEIANLLPQMIDSGLVDEEEDVYAALKDQFPEIYELASGIFDNIKSVGQHACGWIFGTNERPLADWIPSYYIASSKQLVSQYDYKNALLFGLNKGDFLRLKMLSVVSNCLRMIGKDPLDLHQIPLDDPDTFAMIRAGHTEGIFTLQGKTNRQGGIEVEPTDEHGVIASVAIYRPSLTRPGYHRIYNQRRTGREEVSYPHAVAENVLGESYGLPIFQEQILDLGYAIGFDHNEAQELLDAIKLAKGVGRGAAEAFERIHPRFVKRAIKSGLSENEAENVWQLVGSFQGYGFNRGHATSYGILAVRAAYLKCHYPQEYYVSLLDVYPEKHKYVADAKAAGFRLLPPDINLSSEGFSKGVDEKSIRVGLARVHSVGPVALKAILAGQPFTDIDDLKARTPGTAVKANTINALAACGAFGSFGIKGTTDDTELLSILGFLIDKPRAMKGCKPKYASSRDSDTWKHHGLMHGVELSDMRSSVSKLFWIPDLPEKELLKLKASQWARVKTWLLLAVDENGLPFEIMANEDKAAEVDYLKFIARKCRGAVLCLDGAIRKPFETDGPMGFRFFNVTGAFQGEAQVWNIEDEKIPIYFNVLNRRKRQARKAA